MKSLSQKSLVVMLLAFPLMLGCNRNSARQPEVDIESANDGSKVDTQAVGASTEPADDGSNVDIKTVGASTESSSKSTVADQWGDISGQILVEGKAPTQAKIKPDKDKAVCSLKGDLKDKSLIVGKNGGLQNAVLMLSMGRNFKGQFKDLEIHPDYNKTAKDKVLFDNNGCLFEPRVTFVRTSQTLTAKNSDPTGHNVDIRSIVNPINKQIPSRKSLDIKIEGPDRLPVQVACGSHPWMSGRLIFRDEPYVAITGEDGKFEIKNMPAGEWTFVFWHENAGYLKELLNAKGEKVLKGRLSVIKITVKAGETTDLGVMKIPVDSVKPK